MQVLELRCGRQSLRVNFLVLLSAFQAVHHMVRVHGRH